MRQKDDMNELDDTYYIRKILDGDMEFFSRLVDRYSHRDYLLILKIVRYKEEAEELTQDVFVKVFQVLHSFKGDCRFSTWLYRIAYNTAISATRKKKREFLYIEENTIDNVLDEKVQETLDDEQNEEQLQKLEKAVSLLPPDERGLISLFYNEAHSIEEIAEITGLSVSNIKVKLHRVRKKLYVILKEEIS